MTTAAPPAVEFFVGGNPQTKGHIKTFHRWRSDGRCMMGVAEEGGPRLKEWRALVATAAKRSMKQQPPLTGPLLVRVCFYFVRPKAKTVPADQVWVFGNRRHDVDGLQRAILDAMTDAALYGDDSQVARIEAEKRYVVGDQRPGVFITVEAL